MLRILIFTKFSNDTVSKLKPRSMALVVGYHLYECKIDIIDDGNFITIPVTPDQYHDIRLVLENKGQCFVDFEAGETKFSFYLL
jgi:hypothetical protein